MGIFDKGGYQPTAKDHWQMQQEERRWQRSQAAAERKATEAELHKLRMDQIKDQERRDKEARSEVDRIEKEAAEEEKRLLTAPKTKFTGATRKSGPIIVWHHKVEQPNEWMVSGRRPGLGPVLALPPGGGMSAADAALTSIRRKHPEVDQHHPNFIAAHKAALADCREYGIIPVLRDDSRMAGIFQAAGVTSESKETVTETGEYGVYQRPVTKVHVPELAEVVIRASGLELVYRHHLGDSAAAWNSTVKKEALRAAFRSLGVDAGGMEINSTASGDIKVSFNDKDPFRDLAGLTTGTWDDEKFRSLLGIDHQGREVWINWKDASGMVVGGVIGSGKTASMLPVFAGMEGNCELFVFDGKAQRDLDSLRHIARVYDNSGDIDAPLATLEMLERLRVLRGDAIFKKCRAANFWHLTSEQRRSLDMKPIFVLMDEAQLWLKLSTNKERAKVQAQISELVWTLLTKGRSAGIVLILTTQRPSAETISTDIRDNVKLKLCFKVTTPVMAEMILGSQPKGLLDPSSIPVSAQGRFVMDTEGQGMVLGQAGYISPGDLEDQLKNFGPVSDQWAVAERFAGGERTSGKPTPTEPAQSEFTDDALLKALAEAQRRGLIPKTEPAAEPADDRSSGEF